MNVTEIDRRLQQAVANGDVVGLSLALIEDGQIVFARGYGVTAVGDTGLPVDAGTLFPYGSIAKVLCATLVMRLVEQDLLELDRPLLDYLPRLSFSDEAYGRQLTLRHILSHTTGLPAAGRYYGPRGDGALQQVVEAEIPHYAFLAAPGALHLYANTTYCIAGYAAEIVTGRDYDSLLHELVLEPLGMNTTTFITPDVPGRIALPHQRDGDGLRPVPRLPDNGAGHPSSFAYGTASDLAHLAIAHLEQGQFQGRHFLNPQSLAEMHREHSSRHVAGAAHPLAHVSAGYGLGMTTGHYRGNRVLRHGGMTLSCNCFFDLLPDQRAAFVLLTNASDEAALMEVVVFLYDQLLGQPHQGIVPLDLPAPFDESEERERWPSYEGSYLNVEDGRLLAVRRAPERLMMTWNGEELPLTAIGPGCYYAVTAGGWRLPVAFLEERAQPARHIFVAGSPYHRYAVEPVASERSAWRSFAGSYRDPFNTNEDEVLHLRYKDDHLWLREGNGEELDCQPLGSRAFRCDLGFFEVAEEEGEPVLVWGWATRYRCDG